MSQSNSFKAFSSSSSSSSSSSTKGTSEGMNEDRSLEEPCKSYTRGHFFYTREALLQLRPLTAPSLDRVGDHPSAGNPHSSIPAGLIIRNL
ncbi:hypothetical protein Pst134EB_026556 [Puccinia striiformis f. sp. tritici]|uniref:Uncharacterized protein n=2 Tax=Puccinia striiformis TaxID=27350 RepID=A0A0L0V5C0_9BASI|nr:hypothetical protein Pst134EB_026556 [Puccinia striiformis f. sp. tritici]KNE94480.1 hypothetical protein PSTG_12127 [Puccinia striiformis f. sp. tritici PST-78]